MIEVEHVSKRYGRRLAVDDLSFVVRPGTITGFLGPNGAGKSTTMRMMVGLDAPTSGRVRTDGRSYASFSAPLHEVGAMLEARSVHTGRSAYNHLLALAQTHGIPRARIEQVIDTVGLHEVVSKRVGGFSLGMGQRLGIACALLGDPGTLILDEPVNGLDPDGVLWIRTLLQRLASEGRTIFLSSHLMSEMAVTAEHLIVIGRGRLIADTTVAQVVREASSGARVRVRSPEATRLREQLAGATVEVTSPERGVLEVRGLSADRIGSLAAERGIVLHELTPQTASLEEAYMGLTRDAVEYRTGGTASDRQAATGAVA